MRTRTLWSTAAAILFINGWSYRATADQEPIVWSSDYQGGFVTFAVESGKTSLEVNRSSGSATVEATLPGEVFAAPVLLQKVEKNHASGDTPLHALESDWAAQLADDQEWMLANWASADHSDVMRWWADGTIRQASLQALKQHGQKKVVGWTALQGAVVAILEYANGSRMPAALIYEQGRWRRTNALSANPTFDVIFTAVRFGRFTTKK